MCGVLQSPPASQNLLSLHVTHFLTLGNDDDDDVDDVDDDGDVGDDSGGGGGGGNDCSFDCAHTAASHHFLG